MQNKIIAVAGPTASGKTALAVEIAKAVNGEIVSCDSMQIYKGLSIGTAKPDEDEMQGIPHHMLDFVEPERRYSVADFVCDARRCIDDILSRGKVPVIAGGTGLYMDSVLNNISFADFDSDPNFREEMQALADSKGNDAVYALLQETDPEAAEKIHPNNVRRVIRALEVCKVTGKTFTQVNLESVRDAVYDALIIGIDMDRERLYERINLRVDIMLEKGLLEEVKGLWEKGVGADTTAMQAIGYKELVEYFEGRCSLGEAVEKIKMESRRYAKRQLTWFRRNPSIAWFDAGEDGFYEKVFEKCFTFLK
ncbi:MAG: tRNA (adenosine(37)-N6)-dimethylallyltransferase MiaA [Ruminococcaceae bacterium]|nr:tRNA (adenosine(37)-N6)-dimethylallyltransferase MiaA [Oscillospiraceae bacterium]